MESDEKSAWIRSLQTEMMDNTIRYFYIAISFTLFLFFPNFLQFSRRDLSDYICVI